MPPLSILLVCLKTIPESSLYLHLVKRAQHQYIPHSSGSSIILVALTAIILKMNKLIIRINNRHWLVVTDSYRRLLTAD